MTESNAGQAGVVAGSSAAARVERVIVIGGGFGGVMCAKTLRKLLPPTTEVVLFDQENHLVFQPLLAEVVGASLDASAIVVPLRQMLGSVAVRAEEVLSIDFANNKVVFKSRDDQTGTLDYTHVVIAAGGIANLAVLPGMADVGFPMRTIGDAVQLRAHILRQLELAEVTPDPARRRHMLSFIVVGGGYSGVETAGELNDLLHSTRRFFKNIPVDETKVTLIHSQGQLLPEITTSLRDFAAKKMRARGINLMLSTRVASASAEGVTLTDGTFMNGGTIVCTIGGAPAPLVSRMDAAKEKGRLLTEPDMRLKGHSNAWAVGDCAQIVNSLDGQVCGPTGQFAERQGRQTAQNIARAIKGEPTRPFRYKVLGQLCSIGGHSAVAEMAGLRLSGFLAWFVWRGVYLFKLPQWSRVVKVGFDWAWDLLFPRDLALVKADTTNRASLAVYEPGQYVFKEGDPASTFYVIQSGDAEVLYHAGKHDEALIAVLGTGSFFGEKALAENRPREKAVRARTRLEVFAMGRETINEIARHIPPLADALKLALLRRSDHLWDRIPGAQEVLKAANVGDSMRPATEVILRATDPLQTAIERLSLPDASLMLVTDDADRLVGVVTLADIVKRLAGGSIIGASVGDVMTPHPIAVTMQDSCLAAADTAAVHGLRHLAVIDSVESRVPRGYVDIRDLVRLVLLAGADADSAPAR